ncbi:peptidoglycan-binding domain-containing protein [Fortiea contorta]|uniref:peptidoglycan-binding domain-containing protein n=1 Tax=Fortiea contorta TaxID=1892405 RepID=UPI0003460B3C|nr:peptidoglycan-binding protein [Fortiea contorta]
MSELGLLVTGVLKTGQPFLLNLPQKQPIYSENGVHNSPSRKLSGSVVTAKITPPEFIQVDRSFLTTPSKLKPKNENIVNKISKKLPPPKSTGLLAQSDNSESVVAARRRVTRSRFQTFGSRPLPVISFGNSGVAVRVLQRLLISNGYGMRIDGVFGPFTETAVRAFQNQRNLVPDGIVGQRTWRELTF